MIYNALQSDNISGEYDIEVHSAQWGPPQKLPSPVNSEEWEDGPSISPDGETIYFTRGRDRNVNVYYAEKKDGIWQEPKIIDINIENFPTGAPHTQDNKILYFSSVRPGVIGLGDIYVCEKENKKWINVKNIGEPVNTIAMESEPFITANNKYLYFASNREGQGSSDIWMSRKTRNGWRKPTNLGEPVNSKHEESQPFVTADGNELYFMAVNRNGVAGPAIFRSVKKKQKYLAFFRFFRFFRFFKSIKKNQKWEEPEVVISGFVGEPTLTSDKMYLYFVHLIMKDGTLQDAEIMYVKRKN